MGDGVVHTFRSEGAICRVAGQQRVTVADLYRLEPYLNPDSGGAVWSQNGVDQCIEAHLEVETELWLAGRRPYLVVSQAALRRIELLTALRMCCEALSTTGRQTFIDKAQRTPSRCSAPSRPRSTTTRAVTGASTTRSTVAACARGRTGSARCAVARWCTRGGNGRPGAAACRRSARGRSRLVGVDRHGGAQWQNTGKSQPSRVTAVTVPMTTGYTRPTASSCRVARPR